MNIWELTPWIELDATFRLGLAALFRALIGSERERKAKPAGLRTHILVATGAALFTLASIYGFPGTIDQSRVAAGIVVGVGFLGAGTIIHREAGVVGLTTAATIWVVAAIGMAAGAGLYIIAGVTALIAFITLRLPW